MSTRTKLLRWLEYLNVGSWGSPHPSNGHWRTSTLKKARYTDREVEKMIGSGLLTVEGGTGLSREDPVVLRKVPGVLAGREISIILAQKVVGQPSSEWKNNKVEFEPVLEADPPRFLYGILVTLNDGSCKEAWFEVYHLPIRTGQGK